MLMRQPVRQIAYYVNDVREAAVRHSALYGSGPFFATDFPPLPVVHRGKQATLLASSAIGQWGSLQVELIQDRGTGPSILRDLYPRGSGRTGIHHMTVSVDRLEATVASFQQAGYAEATRVVLGHSGLTVVFMDTTSTYGHFIELHESLPALLRLYEKVAEAAIGFDGRKPLYEADLDPDTLELHVKS